MKTFITFLFLVFTFGFSNAQNDNPYAKFGYEGNTLKTPQERLNYMLIIPNKDSNSVVKSIGIEPKKGKYYLFDNKENIIFQDSLSKEQITRFFSLDPLAKDFPHNAPYAFSENRVLDAIELEGLEAWEVKNNWNQHYVGLFRASISNYNSSKEGLFTCDDLGLEVIASFAEKHNLPFVWHTEYKNYDASDKNFSNYESFIIDLKSHSAAPDFANNKNTTPLLRDEINVGSIVVLTQRINPNHIQVISRPFVDDKMIKGYSAIQGNFTDRFLIPRLQGSSNPTDSNYLGVNIQEGFYSFESDTWWNYSNKGQTTNFFEEHYDYELKDFNFNQFNLNSQVKGKDVKSDSKIPKVGKL